MEHKDTTKIMRSDSELLEFLKDQSTEGHYQSTGVFTIDTKLAARKLAAFQLPSRESWILVLVQAAHRGGATKMAVTLLPRQTSVTIFGGQAWSWKELQAVLDGESTTRSDLYTLAVATRALTGQDSLHGFRVIAPDFSAAVWRGQEFRPDGAPAQEQMFSGRQSGQAAVLEVYHIGQQHQTNAFIRALFEQRGDAREAQTAIITSMARDCLASAVPVWCDGRRITGIHLGPPPPAHHQRHSLALLALDDDRIPASDFSAAMQWKGSPLKPKDISIPGFQPVSPRPCAALVMISATIIKERYKAAELGPGTSQLLWVQDGVVVHREQVAVQGTLGVTVVASAGGLKTDLSGLVLVQDQNLDERRIWLREKVRTGLTDLSKQSQEGIWVGAGWTETTTSLLQSFIHLKELRRLGAILGITTHPKQHSKRTRDRLDNERVGLHDSAYKVEEWRRILDGELKSLAERVSSGFPEGQK